jgi:hypothetical protein
VPDISWSAGGNLSKILKLNVLYLTKNTIPSDIRGSKIFYFNFFFSLRSRKAEK